MTVLGHDFIVAWSFLGIWKVDLTAAASANVLKKKK